MPSHTLRTALYLSPSLLVLASSALLIILERVTTSLFRSHTSRDFRTGTPGLSDTDLVVNQDYAPTWALLGAAVLGVLLSCFSAAGMWELRRVDATRGAGQRVWCWGVVGMNAVLLGVSVGVLGWTSGLQAAQSGADLTVAGGGEYTRETWVCRIDALYKDEGWAGSACGTAKAVRFMLIPVAIGALLALVAVGFAARPRGGAGWLFGGKGRYEGFQGMHEMGPQGPPQYQHGAPQFYPAPGMYPQQGYQQGFVQPGYAIPPQGFPQGVYQAPPGSYAPAPMQKSAAAEGQQVFR